MAMNAIREGLLRNGHRVDILTMDTPKFPAGDAPVEPPGQCRYQAIPVDSSIRAGSALRNLVSGMPYHVSRFESEEFRKELENWLREGGYDLVQLEGIVPALYLDTIREFTKAPVILRAHNVEHLIWERVIRSTTNTLFREYLKVQARRLRRWEERIWGLVDGIAAITDVDAGIIRPKVSCPVQGIPFGMDLPSEGSPAGSSPSPALFHIGSMDWQPNQEGMRWFLKDCFPLIREGNPGIRLRLAGRHFPAWLTEWNEPGVEIIGEVNDAHEFVMENDILVVPLLSGSGMRIKIIEAMASGRAVISTSIGMEGVEGVPGRHYHLADTPEEFATAVHALCSMPGAIAAMGSAGRELAEERYSMAVVTNSMLRFYAGIPGIRI